jgi:hypothetical protein
MYTFDVTKSGQEPNVGSLAGIVSPGLPLLARNVSRKCPLFASSRATVCEPLQLANPVLSGRHALV